LNGATRLLVLLLLVPVPLRAQGFLDQFSYEGLHFSGIGAAIGGVVSDRLEPDFAGGVSVDYGNIAPKIRVLFGLSYFRSRFHDAEISRFEDRLESLAPGSTITIGPITWTDYAASLDLQYVFTPERRIRPFVGAGLALHVRDGDGAAISDTFVEDALDAIDAGVAASFGLEIGLIRSLYLTADVRGEATGELRTVVGRAGLMFRIPQGGSR